MNNLKQLLMILNAQKIVSMQMLKSELQFSERKIRNLLRDLRDLESRHGFSIVTVSNQGYFLRVEDQEKYDSFLKQLELDSEYDVGKKDYRIALIIYLLLQNEDYISLNEIAEILDVSRNTIVNDLEAVKEQLERYQLHLISKSHYGVKVEGLEVDLRKMFARTASKVIEFQKVPLEFFEFVEQSDFEGISNKFVELLELHNIVMTNNAIESILFHLKILVYRITQENYISEVIINEDLIDDTVYMIASEIIQFMEEKYAIEIPKQEEGLVASQIFGKASSENVPEEQRLEMEASINEALEKIDAEYATNYRSDELLREGLLLHVYPLLMRVAFGLELNDSLVGSISAQYMNSFLVAMRFIEYHPELSNYDLSRDEIGYLALHFATHIERNSQRALQEVKNVVLVADAMRSTTMLMKARLEAIFPSSKVLIIPLAHVSKHTMDDVDLIVSTKSLELQDKNQKLVVVMENLSENEIRKIRNTVLFGQRTMSQKTLNLEDLFYEELFFQIESGEYLKVIENCCKEMVKKGFADPEFPESVLERERRFSTVYDNGVAAPHSIVQSAEIDSIGVVLLKQPTIGDHKEVRCIFVINVKKGHLFIHQEVSELIVKLMNEPGKVNLLQQAKSYEEFMMFLKEMI